jgi:diaminohydroxyphosphoribosylaminopyrimidine deaminase/5-amino-6-(5-phosphoribosylamino)uracil reductase
VNGKGLEILHSAGVEVVCGFLAEEAETLNEVYFHFMRTGLPFVHIKAGMSMDGRIASSTGKSQWITSETARRYAHRLRQRYDAILVGKRTLLADDPRLDVRVEGGGTIHRIVLDSMLELPEDARLLHSNAGRDIIIATTDAAPPEKIKRLQGANANVLVCERDNGKVALTDLCIRLGKVNITSILVEGGGETIASFLMSRLANKITFVYAPMIIGGTKSVPAVAGSDIDELTEARRLRKLRSFKLGPDIAIEGYLEYPKD